MSLIYHLAPLSRWSSWPKEKAYLPADYEREGFIHCTSGDELMLRVANQYYRNVPGDFVLLVLDTTKLQEATSPIKWEPSPTFGLLFPHIYGPIDQKAVVEVRSFVRAEDGTFTGWLKSS